MSPIRSTIQDSLLSLPYIGFRGCIPKESAGELRLFAVKNLADSRPLAISGAAG